MPQNDFLNTIAKQLPSDTSIIHAVSDTLEISYQSAQRRVNANAKITLEEAIQLAKRYNISLDLLYNTGDKDIITVRKTEVITGIKDLEKYFSQSIETLTPLLSIPSAKIYYAAKDLPIFYTSEGILAKFKLFTWLKVLDPTFKINNFEDFKLPASIIKVYSEFGNLYRGLNIHEIWDLTTINSILKQLHFYYLSEIISKEDALDVCNALTKLIKSTHTKIDTDSNFKMYYNELLLMSNSVLIETPFQNSVFVPFTVINYFNTSDPLTCEQFSNTIKHRIQQSKLLNSSGEKEKRLFFNKILRKVSDLKNIIETKTEFDIG